MDNVFAILFLFVFPGFAIYFGRKWYKLRKEFKHLSDEKSTIESNLQSLSSQTEEYKKRISDLQEEFDLLSPYRQVADAHEEAGAILEKAAAEARAILDSTVFIFIRVHNQQLTGHDRWLHAVSGSADDMDASEPVDT